MAWQSVDEFIQTMEAADRQSDMPLQYKLTDEAIAQFPESSKAWARYANLLTWRGRRDEALPAVEKALELDPESAYAWAARAGVNAFFGYADEAVAAANKAVSLDDSDSFVLARAADALSISGDREGGLKLASRRHDLFPDDIMAASELITQLGNAARKDEAERLLSEAEQKYPDEPIFWRQRAQRVIKSDLAKAAEILRKCTETTPGSSMAWTYLSLACYHSGLYEESEMAALRAYQITPCSITAAQMMSKICERRGQLKEAAEWRRRQADGVPVLAVQSFISNAQIALNRRQWRKALKLADRQVASASVVSQQLAMRIKASALAKMGKLRRAQEVLDELKKSRYDDPLAIQVQADIAVGYRRYDEAIDILRAGIGSHPTSGHLRGSLLRLLHGKGLKEEADALAFYSGRNLPMNPGGLQAIASALLETGYRIEAKKACQLGVEKYANVKEFKLMEDAIDNGYTGPPSISRLLALLWKVTLLRLKGKRRRS